MKKLIYIFGTLLTLTIVYASNSGNNEKACCDKSAKHCSVDMQKTCDKSKPCK